MKAGPALVFCVGARRFAVDAADVAAVARRPPLARAPHAPPAIAGVGALLGRATLVVEMARWLGESRAGGLVLALRGDEPVALAVDAVEGVRDAERAGAERLDWRGLIAAWVRPRAAPQRQLVETALSPIGESAASFLEFSLGGQRFAFAVAAVRAVVRATALASIPEADPVVRGVMAYGEGLLPVVELADLLGLPPTVSTQGWLLVVEIGGAPAALRVERVHGVVSVAPGALHRPPAALNRGRGEARVTAVARAASGLVAILDAERLFDEATTSRLVGQAATAPKDAAPTKADATETLVVFRLGDERYGLSAAAVEAVAKAPAKLSRPPNAPPFLAGAASHRGVTVPLLDQRLRLGGAPVAPAGAVIFVRDGETRAGLLVDAVERLARIPRSRMQPAPPLAGDPGALFHKVALAEGEGKPLLIVDAGPLLAYARRDLAAWDAARPRRSVS